MICWNKENTIFIMAPTGYARRSIEKEGIRVFSPYYGDKLPLRIFRELCFRLPILPKTIWYRKDILINNIIYINIVEINITVHYLNWIKKKFPNSQLNFIYDNMVGKARNVVPDKVPNGYRVWTYDDYDSRKYNIHLQKHYWIREMDYRPRKNPEFDVFFIGRDKGRGEKLLDLEETLHKMHLKTKFIITKDGKMAKKKPYYQKAISYEEVLEYDTKSRAILNITMENQEGITMRDMEAVAIGVKLITTNKNIVNKDLYNRNNVFILGVDNLHRLPEFLNENYVDIIKDIGKNHTFIAMMDELTNLDSRNRMTEGNRDD